MCALPSSLHRFAIACAAALALLMAYPIALSPSATAVMAQRVAVSSEFRIALEPHGQFRRHARWGEVWVPGRVNRDWRPYTVGRWVYTNDYGWYWNAADEEAEWGWIVYHYGRWVSDDELGWVWVPGRQWGPAWVDWRRGTRHVGWAPLPPDEVIVEYREEPRYWIFVEPRNFLATRIATVVVRPQPVLLRETVVVNRTVVIRERNFAVNPGIAPAIVAAQVGRPVQAFSVQPRVIAGTATIRGAVQVRAADLRREDFRRQITRETTVRQTTETIRPAASVPPPRALAANEQGRLGDTPPRAAAGTATEQRLRTQERAATETTPQPGAQERGRERGTTDAARERPSREEPTARERGRERGTIGAAPERPGRQEPAARERAPERGAPDTARERPSREQPAAREGGPDRGATRAAPERPGRPEPAARERGPERDATRAAPERPSRPEPAAREGGPERGATRAAPERPSRPEPAARERGPERGATTGAAPDRASRPEPGARERGPARGGAGAAPERPGRSESGPRESGGPPGR